jgi:signal peptidase I
MVMDIDKIEKTDAKKEPAEEKLPLRRRVLREILAWGWVLAAFLFIHGTLVQARVIPTGSMEETLLVGDHLLVSRFGYDAGVPFTGWHIPLWKAPQRGQMIVFRAPFAGGTDYVKRVIGLPGDRVEIRRGETWINGKPLSEPYRFGLPSLHESYGPETVPSGHFFVMGDNRANSYDSRYWGFVPRENIIGTPVVIYMSVEAPEEAWQPGQIQERFLAYLNAAAHPRLVRWKRLFVTF